MGREHICLHIQELHRFKAMVSDLSRYHYNLILFITQLPSRNNNKNISKENGSAGFQQKKKKKQTRKSKVSS